MLEREAELENHPVIKDIYKKHLDHWKHQLFICKFLRKNYPAILKQDELDYICMMILHNYGLNVFIIEAVCRKYCLHDDPFLFSSHCIHNIRSGLCVAENQSFKLNKQWPLYLSFYILKTQ